MLIPIIVIVILVIVVAVALVIVGMRSQGDADPLAPFYSHWLAGVSPSTDHPDDVAPGVYSEAVINDDVNTRIKDEMRQGMFIDVNGIREPQKAASERWKARPHDHRQVHVAGVSDDALLQDPGGFVHHGQINLSMLFTAMR